VTDSKQAKQLADMEALRRLQKEVEKLRKENSFLKKAAAFFANEQIARYHFINKYADCYGTNWLLQRLEICPNGYYNYARTPIKNKRLLF